MTEVDWMGSTDPQAMLRFVLPHHVNDRVGGQLPSSQFSVTDRKLHLFAVACCRVIWDRLTDPRSRDAVETAERYADGEATDEDMLEANEASSNVIDREWAPYWATNLESVVSALRMVTRSGYLDSDTDNWYPPPETQCHIIRDLFAPFRPVLLKYGCNFCGGCGEVEADLEYHPAGGAILCPESYDEDGRYIGCEKRENWLTPTVLELARAAYASGNPLDSAALAVLADALEEAGCTDEDTLQHCRGFVLEEESTHDGKMHWIQRFTPHYRGCHCLDALLGKE